MILSMNVLKVNMLVSGDVFFDCVSFGVSYFMVLMIWVVCGLVLWLYSFVSLKFFSCLFMLLLSKMLLVLMFWWMIICF